MIYTAALFPGGSSYPAIKTKPISRKEGEIEKLRSKMFDGLSRHGIVHRGDYTDDIRSFADVLTSQRSISPRKFVKLWMGRGRLDINLPDSFFPAIRTAVLPKRISEEAKRIIDKLRK